MTKRIEELYNAKLAIDLDNVSELRKLIVYFNLKSVFGNVKLYETRKGYHLIVDYPSDLDLRFVFGDDVYRIEHSELRGGDDVIFDVKIKSTRYGYRIHRVESIDESNFLCEPLLSKIPRAYWVKSGKKWQKQKI